MTDSDMEFPSGERTRLTKAGESDDMNGIAQCEHRKDINPREKHDKRRCVAWDVVRLQV